MNEEHSEVDNRILELARTDSIIHTGIMMAQHNQVPESEMLIRIILALADANKTLLEELIRIHSRGPTKAVAV